MIAEISDEKIEEAISRQNSGLVASIDRKDWPFKVIRRTKGRTDEITNVIAEVSKELWRVLKDHKVRIGYQVVTALDQTPLIQCFRCMGFSHRARDCTREETCGHCSGPHDSRKCTNKNNAYVCTNCKRANHSETSHPAYSTNCPDRVKWDRIARAGVAYC